MSVGVTYIICMLHLVNCHYMLDDVIEFVLSYHRDVNMLLSYQAYDVVLGALHVLVH